MRLQGKVALVTGGSRGIGRGIVEMFASEGCKVGFTGRSEDTANAVIEAVRKAGGEAIWIKADNKIEADIAEAVAKTAEAFGSLTVIVNNAISATDAASGLDESVDKLDNDNFDGMLRGALYGAAWGAKYAIPHMRKAGVGSIINVSASSSISAVPARPGYQASKGAINSLTRSMAGSFSKENIRTNTIIVGFINTESSTMKKMLATPAIRAAFEKLVQTPRLGRPADIAAAATYLASDESSYVTGTQITVDGGALSQQNTPALDFAALGEL